MERNEFSGVDDPLRDACCPSQAEYAPFWKRRDFPAAGQLVEDLARVRVQLPDGSEVLEHGLHVEPVQLQVVCRRLWAAMPADDRSIDLVDLQDYADIATALAGYYADAVREAAGGNAATERALREWVGERLVVGGIRAPVRMGASMTAGLPNQLIGALVDSYVVRTFQRAGAIWYELGHDRMVEPIMQDNARWEDQHLQAFQVQAKAWARAQRPADLLMGSEALAEAEAWLEGNPGGMSEEEEDFVDRSRAAEHVRQREARDRRRYRIVMWWALGISLLLGVAGWGGLVKISAINDSLMRAEDDAVRAKNEALLRAEREEAAKKDAELSRQLALYMATRARFWTWLAERAERDAVDAWAEAQRSLEEAERSREEAEAAMALAELKSREAKDGLYMQAALRLQRDPAAALPFLALVENPEKVGWRDAAVQVLSEVIPHTVLRLPRDPKLERPPISHVAIASFDRGASKVRRLLASTVDGQILGWAWDGVDGPTAGPLESGPWGPLASPKLLYTSSARIRDLALGPDGRVAAWTTNDSDARVGMGKVQVWRQGVGPVAGRLLPEWNGASSPDALPVAPWAMGFAPDGRLWVGYSNGALALAGLDREGPALRLKADSLPRGVQTVAFEPDEELVLVADDRQVWRLPTEVPRGIEAVALPPAALSVQPGERIRSLVKQPGVDRFAVLLGDGKVVLGQPGQGTQLVVLREAGARCLSFVGKEGLLAVGLESGDIEVFPAVAAPDAERRELTVLRGHRGPVSDLATSQDGTRLVSAGSDGTLRVWTLPLQTLADTLKISDEEQDLRRWLEEGAKLTCVEVSLQVDWLLVKDDEVDRAEAAFEQCLQARGL